MNTAVIYYSMSGNTEYVANIISEKIGAELIKLIPKKEYPSTGFKKYFWCGKSAIMGDMPELEDYEFDASKFDLIIFGTPVWASNFTPPLRTFIEENKTKLNGKKFAVFTCFSGGGAEKTIEKLRKELEIDKFEAELILIDPKDKINTENDKKIEEFCNELNKRT